MYGYKSLSHFLRTYAIILGAALAGFIVRLAKFNAFTREAHIYLFFTSIVLAIVFWEALRFINNWLNKVYPFERNITGRIAVQLVTGSLIGLFIRFIVYWFGEPNLPFKLDTLFVAATWIVYATLPVGINFAFFTNYFIERWKDSIVKNERLEKEKSQVQFDNLKNQLNPHFLFNALTSLNTLIFDNQELASRFLQQLAKVYRYVLQNKDKNFVLLSTELDFIAHYVLLLETRFAGSLKIIFQIDEAAREKAIVPVTLQILIENALKHNITDKDKILQIDIVTVGDYLVVSNNLQIRKIVEGSNKVGLENLKSLYKFLTDRPVIIESTQDRFSVKVPLI